MKILRMRFTGLGSLARVELADLGRLVVIVGKNGSGKSYLLEGLRLFFQEFQVVGGHSAAMNDDFLWHQRRTTSPIQIWLSFTLAEQEAEDVRAALAPLALPADEPTLDIVRELHHNQGWRTAALRLQGTVLVLDDEWAGSETPPEPPKPSAVPGWKLYLFGPADTRRKIEGRALLVKEGQLAAYETDEDFNELAADGWLSVSREPRGQEPAVWAATRGWSLVGRIPNEAEAPELYQLWEEEEPGPKPAPPPALADCLTRLIRSAFTLIPASRHVPSTGSARESLIGAEIVSSLTSVGNSQAVSDEEIWYEVRTRFEHFVDKELEPHPSQFLVRNKTLRLPHQYLGGGEQSVLQIVWEMQKATGTVAVEEPELHLHPSLAKALFETLKSDAVRTQILIATHSPMFIDKSEDACNWLLRLDGLETIAERVSSPDQIKLTMAELGLVPSDVFLKDFVLFVEGATEAEAVVPLWAEKLGLELRGNRRVGLLSIGGDTQAERFLRAWLKVMEHAPADYRVLLDAHAGAIRDKLEVDLAIPQGKIRVLPKVCIEDFYPPKLLCEAVRDLFQEEIQEKDLPKENVAAFLSERLGGKARGGWKVRLGTYVAARMERKDVPAQVSDVLQEIKAALK